MWVGVTVIAAAWLLALSGCDIRERRLPNWLTLPGAVLVLGGATLAGRGAAALAGAAALSVLYLVVHLLAPRAMGGGDVKLAVGLGAMTGAFGVDVWLLAALAAPLFTAALALGAALRGVRTVPHGPSMCVATAAAVALVLV
ncbi:MULTISPECIES: A24 family peptidase [unclassified Mycolicibacterium]|uniref:prepilin peptidase n=1 Tax=unclassified Mycolicibacterium TaxID=2636767 RepID=UPI0012DE331C|nr:MULTISPECIES: A24 family peptidase [unclassified Mycolicibacterium]MUL84416.1 prepilin peptidase [Mycolicibacterium sp. CBMA 329]MUL88191.1 prepilin peptidase [Mycolicibacterium sp. CBMA 331]MUL99360.1 prepilin peptidase [Mycolicibacterium sp. CBMA 334]MUM39838.1 prepilin peptidase [Mycolicibacterium sp. CBMA 247]MUM44256.1 prepilin peptidase [Mycolicibacterium sp. CBMA 294]